MARHKRKGNLGYKKYRCGHCQEESFHHWVEKNRSSSVRCPACGSRDMTAVTPEARSEAAFAQTRRVRQDVPAAIPVGEPRHNRKVT